MITVLLLDVDGNRLLAKYYQPPHAPAPPSTGQNATGNAVTVPQHIQHGNQPSQLSARNPFNTLKEQRNFEKAIWEKTRRASGDIILFDGHLVLFKSSLDAILYVIGPAEENELMLSGLLTSLYDSITMLLQGGQLDKRAVLENLDLVSLAVDETVDDGIILETDSTTVSSRVSRPRPDATDIQINEQTIMNAYSNLKERVTQRILQGGL